VFEDVLWFVVQICKRRSKAANAKSPGPPTLSGKSAQRPYKHLILLPFSAIKRVVDICDTPGKLLHLPSSAIVTPVNCTAFADASVILAL